jgi:hypothetical protein
MLRKWWLLVATQNTQAFFAHCIAFLSPRVCNHRAKRLRLRWLITTAAAQSLTTCAGADWQKSPCTRTAQWFLSGNRPQMAPAGTAPT